MVNFTHHKNTTGYYYATTQMNSNSTLTLINKNMRKIPILPDLAHIINKDMHRAHAGY